MNIVAEQNLFLEHVAKLIQFAQNAGYMVTGGELFRTPEQQELYLNHKPPLTKTRHSKHMIRLAIDLNFFVNGKIIRKTEDLKPLGEYWTKLDPENVWGGSWGWDGNHFQRGREKN